MNRAGADHHDQAGIFAFQDLHNLIPCLKHSRGSSLRQRQLFFKKDGREDNFGRSNAKIICGMEHSLVLNLAAFAEIVTSWSFAAPSPALPASFAPSLQTAGK